MNSERFRHHKECFHSHWPLICQTTKPCKCLLPELTCLSLKMYLTKGRRKKILLSPFTTGMMRTHELVCESLWPCSWWGLAPSKCKNKSAGVTSHLRSTSRFLMLLSFPFPLLLKQCPPDFFVCCYAGHARQKTWPKTEIRVGKGLFWSCTEKVAGMKLYEVREQEGFDLHSPANFDLPLCKQRWLQTFLKSL